MRHVKSVLTYEQYKQKYPGTTMSQRQYEDKYFSDVIDDVNMGVGKRPHEVNEKEKPALQPPRGVKDYPINPNPYNKEKGFTALIDYAHKGKLKNADDAVQLIRHLGYTEHQFAEHLFEGLEKGTTRFEDVRMFQKLGVLPESYVRRKIRWHSLEKTVPEKYHDEYGIRLARTLDALELRLHARNTSGK